MSATGGLPSQDLVDVRLAAAIDLGGCALCAVRARSERATLEGIIAERVLDIGFREGLERDYGFCRRHAVGLLEADRRSSGSLGSSILFGATIGRRVAGLRAALGTPGRGRGRGRGRRDRVDAARRRPPCPACEQGVSAVSVAAARLVERVADPAWAAVIGSIPFCLDDLGELFEVAASSGAGRLGTGPGRLGSGASAASWAAFEPLAEQQLSRLDDLVRRLDGFAHHSAHDRRHLMTDPERAAADEAARALGGD